MSHSYSKQRSLDCHKAYIMKFSWTTRCTLALLEQNHQVAAFGEHKITEECSTFYSNISSVYVFKKNPSPFLTHIISYLHLFLCKLANTFKLLKMEKAPYFKISGWFFFLKSVQNVIFVKTALWACKFSMSKRRMIMLSCMVCYILPVINKLW